MSRKKQDGETRSIRLSKFCLQQFEQAIDSYEGGLTYGGAIFQAAQTIDRLEKERGGKIDWFKVSEMVKNNPDELGSSVSGSDGKEREKTYPRPLRMGDRSMAAIKRIQAETAKMTGFNWSPNRQSSGVVTSYAITLMLVVFNLVNAGKGSKIPLLQ